MTIETIQAATTVSGSLTLQPQQSSTNKKSKPSSHGAHKGVHTRTTSNSSSQKPNDQSRNAKRARWAKSNRPKAKPVVQNVPTREYISVCCKVQARKPAAGQKEMHKDAETGKSKNVPKGLGKWRCGQCGKPCKVTVQVPTLKLTEDRRIVGAPVVVTDNPYLSAENKAAIENINKVQGVTLG